MKKILKLTAVVLLALCLILAVGCGKKDKTEGNNSDYVENEMPVAPPSTEGNETDDGQTGMDNTVDINDLLNPEGYMDEQNEGSGNSAKPSDGSSSSSGTPSNGSSTPSGSSSTSTPSGSSNPSSSTSQPSSSSTPIENDMASGAEADTGSYDTPGWIL